MRIRNTLARALTRASALAIGICCFLALGADPGARAQKVPVPVYKVDPSWPKMPLPNKWLMQGVPDLVDRQDGLAIWVVSRPRDIMPDEDGAATPPAHRLLRGCASPFWNSTPKAIC